MFKNVFFYANLWLWCVMCVVLLPTLLMFLSFTFCLSFFLIELSLLFTLFLTEYIVICVSSVLTMCERIYFVFI